MKGKLFLSVLIGLIMSVLTFVVCLIIAPSYAVLMALLALGVTPPTMHIVLVVSEKRMDKLYAELERGIRSPVFYKTNGNIDVSRSTVNYHCNVPVMNGNVYFCEHGIVLASVDQKPYYFEEVSADNILKYEFEEIHMHLYTKDGGVYMITLADIPEVREALRGKYWA